MPWSRKGKTMSHANPQPAKKKSKLKWVVIIVGLLFVLGMCSVAMSGGDDESSTASNGTTTAEVAPAPGSEAEPQAEPEADEPEVPREFDQAKKSAEMYLRTMPFSRTGLIDQLAFESYSPEAAEYAVDNVEVDWNEQAVKSAESYLRTMPFSPAELVDQLIFEGYTPEQAQHGVDQAY